MVAQNFSDSTKAFLRALTVVVFVFATVLVTAAPAAALPEICGNGLDDDGAGGDAPCGNNDKDNDGFAANVDCDDNNYKIYPGVHTGSGCSAGQTHYCQGSGAYTACTSTPVCEATGSGTCRYIDCTAGNDAGDGSFANPWRSPKKAGGFESPELRPAGWYDIKAGDVIYFKGSGTCSATYNPGSGRPDVMFFVNRSGTLTNPIVIKRYPGSSVVFDPPFTSSSPGHVIFADAVSNVRIEDFDITGSYAAVIYLTATQNIEVARVRCHDTQGTTLNNVACINAAVPTGHYVHHNEFFNVYDPAQPSGENVSLIVYFKGGGNRFEYNRLYYTNDPGYGGPITGRGFKYKHPATVAGTLIFRGNQLWNIRHTAVGISTPSIRMDHNLVVNTGPHSEGACAYMCGDLGVVPNCNDQVVEYNTFVNSQAFCMRGAIGAGLGVTQYRNNVVQDNTTSYNSENGFFRVERYGDAALYNLYTTLGAVRATNNCYYNPGAALVFDYFGDGGAGGGMYSFSQWRANGFDSGSFNENPAFNAAFGATSANCSNFGWQSGGSGGTARPNPPTGLSASVVD